MCGLRVVTSSDFSQHLLRLTQQLSDVLVANVCRDLSQHSASKQHCVCTHIYTQLVCVQLPTYTENTALAALAAARRSVNQAINQSCIFRVVQVIKSFQDPLEVENNLMGINDKVREQSREQKCF